MFATTSPSNNPLNLERTMATFNRTTTDFGACQRWYKALLALDCKDAKMLITGTWEDDSGNLLFANDSGCEILHRRAARAGLRFTVVADGQATTVTPYKAVGYRVTGTI